MVDVGLSPDFHLGILAPEYPPEVGGMQELARGLAMSLSKLVEVSVFTKQDSDRSDASGQKRAVLTLDLETDAALLEESKVDAWLAMNSGLIPIGDSLSLPFFTYAHGNDFLQPWIPCGPRWIETIRRPYAASVRHWLRRRSLRRSIASSRLVFCNSSRTAELLRTNLGLGSDKIRKCPPGVDEVFFSVDRSDPHPGLRLLTVATLSRFVPRKNIEGVIRAVRLLTPKVDISYTVVGDGDDLPRLKTLADDLGLRSQVHFRGRVDQEDLLSCYAEADLFILASKASERDVEGFGIVFIEASASGVPVIASREGGATDAVQEGVNGLIIPDSSPESIARGIERYLAERERFETERIRGFAEQFRWSSLAPQ
ncbi:MAG: glycosyltransferase family 4 protein, partial [Thermoanaerobaculia bacterium]